MKNGPYELVIAPDDFPGKKYRDIYCYEHTLVWWINTGVIPKSNEIIHHKQPGNKRDNRFENLELLTNSEHAKLHGDLKTEKKFKIKVSKLWNNF